MEIADHGGSSSTMLLAPGVGFEPKVCHGNPKLSSAPHFFLQTAFKDSKSNRKILAAHLPLGQATINSERTLDSFIGECVDITQIPDKFAYVALGHMHKFQQPDRTGMPIVYSGSSERCEWEEECDDKFAFSMDVIDVLRNAIST